MNRQRVYEEWLNTTYIGQNGEAAFLCDEGTIENFRKVNDINFHYYVQWQNNYVETKGLSSVPRIRSEILNFLTSDMVSDIPLEIVDAEVVDAYIINRKDGAAKSTFLNRISYLTSFFSFLCEKKCLQAVFDSEKYRKWAEALPDEKPNSPKILKAEQVANLRHRLIVGAKKIPKYREYLYIFDMLYYTELKDNQIKALCVEENINIEERTIVLGNKSWLVPQETIDNILWLNENSRLGNLPNVSEYIKKMKLIFEDFGIENIKKSDIQKTREHLFMMCPKCETRFEPRVENWCAQDLLDSGMLWIVCRRCGNA